MKYRGILAKKIAYAGPAPPRDATLLGRTDPAADAYYARGRPVGPRERALVSLHLHGDTPTLNRWGLPMHHAVFPPE